MGSHHGAPLVGARDERHRSLTPSRLMVFDQSLMMVNSGIHSGIHDQTNSFHIIDYKLVGG